MKSRISSKFLVVLALLTLIINIFTSFGAAFVQAETIQTGYKIDVKYQDGMAILQGNLSNLKSGYSLTSLVDDSSGQSYDPNNFTMQLRKNGTYNFTLSYTAQGISNQAQTEKIQVVVDKLTVGNSKSIAETEALPTSTIQSRATTEEQNLTVDAYAYETKGTGNELKLNSKTLSIPSGSFSDNQAEINTALSDSTRVFAEAVLYRTADNSAITLSSAWKIGNDVYYTTESDKSSPVAYKAQSGDTIRIYYKINSDVKNSVNVSSLTSAGYQVKVDPSANDVIVGSWVTVSVTWPASVQKINSVSVSSVDTSEIKVLENNTDTRSYVFRFKMPNTTANITVNAETKTGKRWVGIYDNANRAYQGWELGYTAMAVASVNGDPGNKISLTKPRNGSGYKYATQTFLYRFIGDWNGYAGRLSADLKDMGISFLQGYGNYADESTTVTDYTGTNHFTYNVVHNDLVGNVQTGQYSGGSVKFPVQDYNVGQPVYLYYESKRGRPLDGEYAKTNGYYGYDKSTGFLYYPVSSGTIDVYKSTGSISTTNYTSYGFRTYQSQAEYEEQKKTVTNLPAYSSDANGLYPVSTTLPNGIQIVSVPVNYDPKSSTQNEYGGNSVGSDKGNDMTLPWYTYKIIVYNAYDDFRVDITGNNSGANNWYRFNDISSGITNISMNAGKGNEQSVDSSKTVSVNSDVKSNFNVTASEMPYYNSNSNGYMQLDVTVKKGYAVPKPTMIVSYADNTPSSSNFGKYTISDKSTVSDVGNVNNKNNLIFTKLKSSDSFYDASKNSYRYYIWTDGQNGSAHDISFSTEPIIFSYSFSDLNISGNDINIENKRYFSVPSTIPTSNAGLFSGWKIQVSGPGLSQDVTLSNNGTNTFKPGDLIDISNVYDQIAKQFNQGAIGSSSGYKITATPQYTASEAITAKGTITRKIQSSYSSSDYKVLDANSYYLLKNSSFVLSDNSAPQRVEDSQKKIYRLNTATSKRLVENFDGSNSDVATLYYDRAYNVTYNLNSGSSSGKIPGIAGEAVDTTYYTLGTDPTSNKITLPDASLIKPPSGRTNATFIGWKITSGTASQLISKDTKELDLSKLNSDLGIALLNSTSNTIQLVAQYADQVSQIQTTSGQAGGDTQTNMSDAGKWIYSGGGETGRDDKNFTVSATFKYAGTNESYQNAKANNQIYYALYKQNPNNGVASTSDYQLWKSSSGTTGNKDNEAKVKSVQFSDSLDSSGNFTITVTIQNVGNSISYASDNAAKYRIYSWSSANEVDGSKFGQDGSVKALTISNSDTTPKLPSTTLQTRVLDALNIANTSNNELTGKKLLYADQSFDISFEINTGSTKLTQDELSNEINFAIGKQDPGANNIQLWYSNKALGGWSGGSTAQGGLNTIKKFTAPSIEIKNADSSGKSNTFIVTVKDIRDTTPIQSRYQSNAKYYVYAWDKANKTPPTISQGSNKNNWNISNADSIDVPHKVYTTYVVDSSSSNTQDGKAYNGVITYPTNARLEKKEDGKVKSSMLSVNLHGVWTTSSGQVGEELNPSDKTVEHDYAYQVKVVNGGTTTVSASNTQLKLSQNITGGLSFVANVLKDGKTQLSNGVLGTLNFAANGNPVTSLDFQVVGDSPGLSSKDEFSGTMQYEFTQQKVNTE